VGRGRHFFSVCREGFQAVITRNLNGGKAADACRGDDAQAILKAWKFTKRYGIRIRGTDNLPEYLIMEPQNNDAERFPPGIVSEVTSGEE
jgi:hypothetical protein